MSQKNRPGVDISPSRIRALRLALGVDQAEFGMLIGQEAREANTADGIRIGIPTQADISRWEIGPGELYGAAILRIEERLARVGKFEEEVRGGTTGHD